MAFGKATISTTQSNISLRNTMGRFFSNNVKKIFFPNSNWCQTPFTNIEINKDGTVPYLSSPRLLCVNTQTSV